MIFRTQLEGDFVEINRNDYSKKSDYLEAIMNIFNVKQQVIGIRDDVNQLDLIYNISKSNDVRPSKL